MRDIIVEALDEALESVVYPAEIQLRLLLLRQEKEINFLKGVCDVEQ